MLVLPSPTITQLHMPKGGDIVVDMEDVAKMVSRWWTSGQLWTRWSMVMEVANNKEGGASIIQYFWVLEYLVEYPRQWVGLLRTPSIVPRKSHFNQTMPTLVLDLERSSMCCNLRLVEWLLGQWGILKHFPQSSCIFISHWSREN